MAKKLSTSPAGIAVYPRVTGEPDTKFNAAGVYSTKVRFEGEAAQKFTAEVEAAMEESYAKAVKENKGKKIKRADSPVQEQEDGSITANFKMTASGVSKKTDKPWSRKPRLFDAKGTPLDGDKLKVGGGSRIKVSYELSQFYTALLGAGVSLRLEAVQILELVEFGGGNAKSFGFGEEEGFEVNDTADAEAAGFGDSAEDAEDQRAAAAPVSGKKADF